jgi:hypothetical protein
MAAFGGDRVCGHRLRSLRVREATRQGFSGVSFLRPFGGREETHFTLPCCCEFPESESAEFKTSLAKKYLPSLGTIMI